MLLPGSQRHFEVLGNVLRVKCAVPWRVGLLSEIKCFFLREGVRRKQTSQVISQEQSYCHAIISRKSQVDQSLCTSTTAKCVPGLKRRRHWPRKKTKGTIYSGSSGSVSKHPKVVLSLRQAPRLLLKMVSQTTRGRMLDYIRKRQG